MKKTLLISFCFLFLIFPKNINAASFSISNPTSGNCFTPGQTITIRWGVSTDPTTKHYAIAYRTDGLQPPQWTSSPGAWNIGHDFGGIGSTSISWSIPNVNSTNVKIWVEAHKNNHSRVEIVSSGAFSIMPNCSTTPPPPPPVTKPPPPPAVTNPSPEIAPPDTPVSNDETQVATDSVSSLDEHKNSSETATIQEKAKKVGNTKLPKVLGMLYLVTVGSIIVVGLVYLLLKTKIWSKFRSKQMGIVDILPDQREQKTTVPIKSSAAEKSAKNEPVDNELTLDDLAKLRNEELKPKSDEK